jgi:hypothetical protein
MPDTCAALPRDRQALVCESGGVRLNQSASQNRFLGCPKRPRERGYCTISVFVITDANGSFLRGEGGRAQITDALNQLLKFLVYWHLVSGLESYENIRCMKISAVIVTLRESRTYCGTHPEHMLGMPIRVCHFIIFVHFPNLKTGTSQSRELSHNNGLFVRGEKARLKPAVDQ